jgi:hypothetical protein
MLEWVKTRPVSPWVYPMLCFAAHTGARRSEIVRALPSDLDLASSVVTIREKKRDKTKTTTRRVPLTPLLKKVMANWMKQRARGTTLFCKGDGKEIAPREAMNYLDRALRVSKWKVLRGFTFSGTASVRRSQARVSISGSSTTSWGIQPNSNDGDTGICFPMSPRRQCSPHWLDSRFRSHGRAIDTLC